MCSNTYTYLSIYRSIHPTIHIYIHMCVCVFVYTYKYVRINTHTHTLIYIYTHIHSGLHIHTHILTPQHIEWTQCNSTHHNGVLWSCWWLVVIDDGDSDGCDDSQWLGRTLPSLRQSFVIQTCVDSFCVKLDWFTININPPLLPLPPRPLFFCSATSFPPSTLTPHFRWDDRFGQ